MAPASRLSHIKCSAYRRDAGGSHRRTVVASMTAEAEDAGIAVIYQEFITPTRRWPRTSSCATLRQPACSAA
jgi:hypothetical protein